MLSKQSNHQGFTLLEILLVVGIIAILAGIAIVAINPSKQLAQVRNTERKSDLKQIANAITQFYIDNSRYPTSLTGDLTEICDTGASSSPSGVDCTDMIDLSELVPTYITAIPKDPSATTTYHAGYKVIKTGNQIGLSAPAELGQVIILGKVPTWTTISGLVAHYLMNDNGADLTILDSSGNGRNVTLTIDVGSTQIPADTSEMAVQGLVGGALWPMGFNRAEIDLSTDGFADLLGGDWSYTRWIRKTHWDDNTAWGAVLFALQTDASPPLHSIGIYYAAPPSSLSSGVYIQPGDGSFVPMRLGAWADDSWHHLVVTRVGSTITMYIDGTLAGTADTSYEWISTAHMYILGMNWWAEETTWYDDVRIYNRALSPVDVAAIYNGGAGTEAE